MCVKAADTFRMEFLRRREPYFESMEVMNAWSPTLGKDFQTEDTTSMLMVLRPVFIVGRLLGFPFEIKFRWFSLRALWLLVFISYASVLTLLTIYDNIGIMKVGSIGAILFYLISTTYLFYLLWVALSWHTLRNRWLELEKKMRGFPKAPVNTTITTITTTYIVVGLCEHSFSILDNLRQVKNRCQGVGKSSLELYYLVHYKSIFQHVGYEVWKGVLTSIFILTLTVVWTFTDVFTMTVTIALSVRFQQLRLALTEVKGKDMPLRFWKKIREIYLELYFITRQLDEKISFLFFISLGNNVYSVILMLLNALSLKSNKDFLQTAYYMLSVIFVTMRLTGVCLCAAKINEQSRSILPLLFAVPSASYCIEVHRFVMHVWYDPLAMSAFNFFSITRSTILKIAGSILTYEIVLVQFNLLNANETDRRPKAECPYNISLS